MSVELRHLRYFVAVAEELNFTRAAERVHTAQPSLSQQIRQLEYFVGAPLFYRTKRKVELTEAGAVFLDEARQVLARADEALISVKRNIRGEAGELAIGFVPAAELGVMEKLVPEFRRTHPNVHVNLQLLAPGDVARSVMEGAISIGFVRLQSRDDYEQIEKVVVQREHLLAVLPEGHELAENETVDVKDLAPRHERPR